MSSSRTHSVQWSPHPGHNAFLVGSTDLRLYDYQEDDEGKTRPSLVAVNSDLALMKCFDWSPDPNYQDLVAVGYTNGRTVLVRMHATSSYHPSEPSHYSHATQAFEDAIASVSPGTGTHPNGRVMYSNPPTPRGLHPSTSTSASPPYPALNVRHSRACNVVSFCPPQPHFLATGLDRARGEVSLMVWDVSQAQGRTADHAAAPVTPITTVPPALSGAASGVFGHGRPSWADRPPLLPSEGSGARTPGTVLNLGGDGFFSDRSRLDVGEYMAPRVTPPAPSARRTNDDPRPIQQYGNSEPVISCTWVPTGSPKLVAGMMKSVKIYDLRVEGTAASISFSTKAVYGINVDPFHTHRFASYTEEGAVNIWDMRKTSEAVLTISADIIRASATVGLSRIAFSPTRSGLLATLSRDARVVCLWDIQEGFPRSSQLSNASFLSATQRAAAATGAAGGGTNPPSPFSTAATGVAIPSGMGYSGLNMGINLQVSPGAVGTMLVSPGVVGGSDMERGASNTGSGMSADSSSGEEDAFDILVLWKSRKTQPSSKILSSFAWMPHSSTQSANSASVHRLISVNKDGFTEAVRLQEALKFSWEPTGNILLTGGGGLEIHGTYHSPPSASAANDADQTHTGAGSLNDDVPFSHQRAALRKQNLSIPRSMSGTSFLQQQDPSFLRLSTSLQTNGTSTTDNSTGGPTPLARNGVFYHRPGELQQRRANQPSMLSKPIHLDIGHGRHGGARPERTADDVIVYVEGSALAKELEMDMSVVMRGRADDYSMDCETNQKKLKYHRKLPELWSWMAQSEHLASETKKHTGAVDYSFQGIHAVWMGSNTASQNHKKVSPLSTPKTTSPLTRPLVHQPAHVNISLQESTSSSSSSTGTSATLDQSAAAATTALNLGRRTPNVSPDDELEIVPTARQAQRRLALWMCGFGFTKTQLEVELGKLEADDANEKAAGWALFNGQTERAIKALNNSSDQHRKLMSAALAGYQNNTSQAKDGNGDTLWQNLARSMVNDLTDEPYLRTMFAYLASDDWGVVLGEKQLSLRERVAVALRVLTDDELTVYVENLVRQVVAEGDIEGLFLTGLTKEGVDLFEQYVNSTDDIQTAALVLSFCVPSKFQDRRVDEWVESYRLLLDRWQLYHTRARFDIERGKRYGPTPGAAAEITPSQVYVQCRFCAQSLAHSVQIQNVRNRDGRRIVVQANVNPNAGGRKKSTVCPSCSKPLPRCALCLLNLGTPTDSLRQTMATNGVQADPSGFDLWFTWCQTCRHGGHAIHMRQWFEGHQQCPVSDCSCRCQYL